jgi:hypothetical protein
MRKRLGNQDSWPTFLKFWLTPEPRSTHDDRATAIVLAAILEEALEIAIATHFVVAKDEYLKLFDDRIEGILSGFAAKISIGFALGIYEEKMRSELRWIKDMRNAFAHTRESIDFNTPEIAASCESLFLPKNKRLFGGVAGAEPITSRDKFVASVRLQFAYLNWDQTPMVFNGSNFYRMLFFAEAP